ncbi:FimB/Mfa2 family fimbrial subunit [Chitinophaga sp.]|uniref:FimB/Mfa2 family fimbrial subunit n=1 Tax=Chitinophaga sp. TaxID=1869181 RepID=UPI002F925D62
MKRVLFLPLLVSMLFACKKDAVKNDPPVDSVSDKKAISISIADFIREEENMRSAKKKQPNSGTYAKEDSARISDIYYIAYNSNGNKVSLIHQDTVNQSSSFGTISDSLASGSYTIVLIASEKPLYTETFTSPVNNPNISSHSFGPAFLGAVAINPLGDLFFKKIQVDIAPTGNPTSLEVTLNRIVGKLEVNILDALPATDPNGYIGVQVTPLSIAFNLADESISQPESIWQWIGTRTSQHTFKDYLFGANNEFNVVISYKDKNTGADLVKTIEHVTCHTNKKTIITGYLYGTPNHPGGPDYQVKLNQSWDSDSTVINF